MQDEVLNEIKDRIIINNESDLDNNFIALTDGIIEFHGGVPLVFAQQGVANPGAFPDGKIIADFTIKEGMENLSGTIACTVHGEDMSFRFDICP